MHGSIYTAKAVGCSSFSVLIFNLWFSTMPLLGAAYIYMCRSCNHLYNTVYPIPRPPPTPPRLGIWSQNITQNFTSQFLKFLWATKPPAPRKIFPFVRARFFHARKHVQKEKEKSNE